MISEIDLQWFAAEDEGRTEEPSEIKLERARKEGRVAKSQEFTGALVLLMVVLTLIVLGPWILEQIKQVTIYYFTRCTENQIDNPAFAITFFYFFLKIVLPVALIGSIAGIAGNLIQNRGFLFSTKPIQPQFSKILPNFAEYFRKTFFSFEGGFNIAKSIGKIVIISSVSWVLIRSDLPSLLMMLQAGNIDASVGRIAFMAAQILVTTSVLFLVISIPDYFVQRRQFLESMKMTKQEVKQEYKEMEGDPEVKSHLEQAQRQLLQRNMPRAVAESDVVITNPTHFAVALKYDPDVTEQSPQVTAKGADEIAFAIKRIARENDVPVIENRPLARGLYTDTQVGDIIPDIYMRAIVLVYTEIDYYSKIKK